MKQLLLIFSVLSFVPAAFAQISFERQVWPIVKDRCLDCHRAPYVDGNGKTKKPKGDLRVDSPQGIMAGGENGPVIMKGKPTQSTFYTRTVLPEDDDDIMPPKGDLLTKTQARLIGRWILEGAKFGSWRGTTAAAAAAPARVRQASAAASTTFAIDAFAKDVKPLPSSAYQQAKVAGVLIRPLSRSNPLLRVEVLTQRSEFSDAELERLAPVASHITQLILRNTGITDAGIATIAKMPRLTKLDLSGTKITGSELAALGRHPALHTLTLFGTEVTSSNVGALGASKSLRRVYLWQSKVDDSAARSLDAKLREARVEWASP
ncbi:MAG: hypothetical protein ACI8W8_001913, partial [Rhodothermales bacterium]